MAAVEHDIDGFLNLTGKAKTPLELQLDAQSRERRRRRSASDDAGSHGSGDGDDDHDACGRGRAQVVPTGRRVEVGGGRPRTAPAGARGNGRGKGRRRSIASELGTPVGRQDPPSPKPLIAVTKRGQRILKQHRRRSRSDAAAAVAAQLDAGGRVNAQALATMETGGGGNHGTARQPESMLVGVVVPRNTVLASINPDDMRSDLVARDPRLELEAARARTRGLGGDGLVL